MSLLLKRVYPSAEDFDGNIAQLHKALMPAKVSGEAKAGGQSERFIAMMDYGVTIYLPGEEPDPYTSLVDSTPYVARFGQQVKKADDSDPILAVEGGGDDAQENQARRVLKVVLRSLIKRLKAGGRIEILPGRYWQLLKNKSLAAELCTDLDENALMLEERTGDADKPLPDALYCLQRLDQHSYLADLMASGGEAAGPDEEEFDFGSPFSKDISLFDLHSAFGGGVESDDSDDDEDDAWKSE